MPVRRLFIDPSSHSTGWSLFSGDRFIKSGTLAYKNKNKWDRYSLMFNDYRDLAKFFHTHIDEAYIEVMHIAQSRKQIFNMKPLIYSVGVIGMALRKEGVEIFDNVIYPNAWKAFVDWNETKTRTGKRKRLRRYVTDSEDELSAIGMGIYFTRKWLKENK